MLRMLELSWLTVSVFGVGFSVYKVMDEGVQSALFVLFFTAIAFIFYLLRRKQRIQQEKFKSGKPS